MEKFSCTLALSPRTVQILRDKLVRRFGEDMWTRFLGAVHGAQRRAARAHHPRPRRPIDRVVRFLGQEDTGNAATDLCKEAGSLNVAVTSRT